MKITHLYLIVLGVLTIFLAGYFLGHSKAEEKLLYKPKDAKENVYYSRHVISKDSIYWKTYQY